jgi:hypothetical protein
MRFFSRQSQKAEKEKGFARRPIEMGGALNAQGGRGKGRRAAGSTLAGRARQLPRPGIAMGEWSRPFP